MNRLRCREMEDVPAPARFTPVALRPLQDCPFLSRTDAIRASRPT